jgi:hypothetical protein
VQAASLNAYENALVWQDFFPINGVLNGSNFSIKDQLKIYPNPVKNELFINTQDLTDTKLEVFDFTGNALFSQALNPTNTIDTSTLSKGVYLFKVTSNEGSMTSKIIK